MGSHVVTGASTGIGRATALALAARGEQVLAGVRREADAPEHALITPLVLDVTDPEHLERLGERLASARLDGLVNNAGVVVSGPLEAVTAEEWRLQLEVNVVALALVTRAALPALRAARGRVVNVGSIGAVVSPPFMSPYAASKAAVRGLSASLRRELLPLGVQVVLVEPGAIATPIWAKGLDAADARLEALSPALRTIYGGRLAKFRELTEKTGARGLSPEACAEVIVGSLLDPRPRAQRFVGREARVNELVQRLVPGPLFDRLVVRQAGGS